ncbi:MAG: DMT family transporter [Burkholderiales bacterium]|nr:DMT family transporter [Burkholderiales bacterium]
MPHGPTGLRALAYAGLAAAMLAWSGNWIVGRAVRDDIAAGYLTAGRVLVMVALLAPFALPGLRAKLAGLSRRELALVAALGFTGGGPHNAMQYLGMHYTTATNGTLLNSFLPMLVMLFARFMIREPVSGRQLSGVAVSFAGILAIVSGGDPAALAALRLNPGDLLVLASLVLLALFTVLLRSRADALSTAQLLFMVGVTALPWLVPWLVWEWLHGATLAPTATAAGAVLYAGLIAGLGAYVAWNFGVRVLGAGRASVFVHLLPAFGVVLAAIFLGEAPCAYHFAGIALVLAGIALAAWRKAAS